MDANRRQRVCLFLTLFAAGGLDAYWRDIVDSESETHWDIFTNSGSTIRPFAGDNVNYVPGICWPNWRATCIKLFRYVREFRPDQIIFNGTAAEILVLPILPYLLLQGVRVKCVFHNRNIYKSRLKSFLNRLALSLCAHFHHDNTFVSQSVKAYWLCRGTVRPRPFQAQARPIVPKLRFALGFLGRISWEKGPDQFFQATLLARQWLMAHGIEIDLVMIGDGPMRPELEVQFPDCHFTGWVNEPRKYLRDIDLLIVSSRTEGYPMAIGESLEEGTPVVGFNVGGVRELLPDAAKHFFVDDQSIDRLAKTIVYFLTHFQTCYQQYFVVEKIEKNSVASWARQIVLA